jgi:hypothetical protein
MPYMPAGIFVMRLTSLLRLSRLLSFKKAAALFFVALLTACSQGTDREQIAALIEATEQAAESRDTSEVMKVIADDYRDAQGMDKSQLQNFLRGYFLTHPKIELIVRIGDIKVETAARARAQIELVMVGTVGIPGDSALTGNSESLEVDFRKIDGEWRAVRMERVRN